MQHVPIPAINLSDGYKVDHRRQHPEGLINIKSNFTPRKSRVKGVNHIVWFSNQYFIKRYLIEEYNKWFAMPEEEAVRRYKRRIDNYLGPKHRVTFDHIRDLHRLQFLPVTIKALPEGSLVPMRVAPFSVDTDRGEKFSWLVQYLETLISCVTWGPCTSATTAREYKRRLRKWAMKTVGNTDFIPFQGHDFSFRGMFGPEAAMMSGAAHLCSFVGTDTIPAIDWLEEYYGADSDKELVGCSVGATEHAVMCMGTGFFIWDRYKGAWERIGDAELDVFVRIITEIYPDGIISIVSDTWNLWKVVTEFLPAMKDTIMARDGRVVIRPDSSPKTPVEIICGDPDAHTYSYEPLHAEAAQKGLVESLWDIFGGTVTEKGFRLLDTHIGTIYGDSITLDRADEICQGLYDKNFASINTVMGIGSYTYQGVTRDTFGWAMKATWGLIRLSDGTEQGIEVFKDPITDDGTKKSARGILVVEKDDDGEYTMRDQATLEDEETNSLLKPIFHNGKILVETTLSEIRGIIDADLAREEEIESKLALEKQ